MSDQSQKDSQLPTAISRRFEVVSHNDTSNQRSQNGDGIAQIEFREFLRSIWRRKLLFFLLAVAALLTALLYVSVRTPLFTATGLIYTGESELDELALNFASAKKQAILQTKIEDEIQKIHAPEFITLVIENLKLTDDPEFAPDAISFNEQQSDAAPLSPRVVYVRVGGMFRRWVDYITSFLPSDDDKVGSDVDANQRISNTVLWQFRENLDIRAKGTSSVIEINFTSSNPTKAARIVNQILDLYIAERLVRRNSTRQTAALELRKRVQELQNEIVGLERNIETDRAAAGLLEGTSGSLIAQQISDLNAQLISTRVRRLQLEETAGEIRDTNSVNSLENIGIVAEVLNIDTIERLEAERATLTQRMAEQSAQYGKKHPTMVGLITELEEIELSLEREVQRALRRLAIQLNVLKKQENAISLKLNQLKSEIARANSSNVQLRALQRAAEARRVLLADMLGKLTAIEVEQEMSTMNMGAEILSKAKVPTVTTSPTPPMVVVVFLVSFLLIGGAGMFVRELLRRGFVSGESLRMYTHLPVVGLVPRIKRSLRASQAPEDIVVDKPLSAFGHSVREILSNTMADGSGPQSLLITSADEGEGKSTIAVCLSRIAVLSGYSKVLLIDGDLYRHQVHKKLNSENNPGLINILLGEVEVWEALQNDGRTGLDFIAAGSVVADVDYDIVLTRFRELLYRLMRRYDLIIVDGPPLLSVPMAVNLANAVEAAMVVVRWEKTERELVRLLVSKLRELGIRKISAILNMVELRQHSRIGSGDARYYGLKPNKYYLKSKQVS